MQADQKIKYEKQSEEIKAKVDALKVKLEELENSGEQAWHTLKEGIDRAVEDIRKSIT
ncbi:MAG: hypothetical protein GWO07_02725 [Candidatus Dadabacteria bacterium]|nr:hypothetical protein [Candidatus Dadabacteria bacterium]NIS07682.1 hypothetical protein [Candidatus Dadabacteria bacterium]NIV42261.1 hypothetical protein [Candidatus Dadabacteria bacterium]NIX14768.1 hypothetical protein [Candidatus Dadabacteria bacterium]NIY21309.1 hypothetical protein [Candidatus Dadabacteria bacterium]